MRIYSFIIPYILSRFCVTIALSIPAPVSKGHHLQQPRRAFGSFLRRSVAFPKVLVRVGFPARVSVAELVWRRHLPDAQLPDNRRAREAIAAPRIENNRDGITLLMKWISIT